MKKKMYPLLLLCTLLFEFGISQTIQNKSVRPFIGQAGIRKKVADLISHSLSENLKKKPLDSTAIKPYRSYFKRYAKFTRPAKGASTGIPIGEGENEETVTSAQRSSAASSSASSPSIWSNFLSTDFYESLSVWPPDPSGAVSGSQVIVATNGNIKIFAKPGLTDAPVVTPKGYSRAMAKSELFIPLDVFFSPVLPAKSSISDPHIRYDRLSKRWFVVAIEVNQAVENNSVLLAISDGDKINSSSDFIYYSFNSSLFPYDSTAPYAPFFDFPTLGMDKNSVVIGGNQFGYDSITNVGYVIDKKKLLRDQLVVYPFELGVADFITGDVRGMYTPQGVYNDDPLSKRSFFAGTSYYQDALVLASIEYNSKTQPHLASTYTIPIEPFNNPRDNSHPGSMVPLQQNDTRLLQAEIHKNKNNNLSSLWTSHAIGVSQSGHFIAGSDSDFVREGRTGSRWYQVNDIYYKPRLNQVGTLHDESEKSGRRAVQYFNPTIAANGQGHAVLGGTTDAFNQYLNVFVAEHYYGDTKGTLTGPVKATNTTAIYAPYIDFGYGSHYYIERWGDFSQTVVDPMDDQTIWTFQEYANVDDSYGVRAVQVKAPPAATPLPIGNLSNNTDTVITLTANSVDNSGFFDPGKDEGGPGYNRFSVKSTGDIIVSNVKVLSPTKISFKLNTKNKAAGQYFLIITNPDGQFAITQFTIDASTSNQRPALAVANVMIDKTMQEYIVTSDIYPNPTRGEFKLQLKAAKNFQGKVRLITADGKMISENSYNFIKGSAGEGISLSLAGAGNGNYLAAIYNTDNVLIAVHKIVKQ